MLCFGFICLAFPCDNEDAICNYVSNLKREDAIRVLKTWLIKSSGEEEWMKHIT